MIKARLAEPEANARCGYPGQPCGKAKRVALPEPEADARCGYPGQPCGKAKREADARCGYPGQPCSKVKRAAEAFAEALAAPEASPDNDHGLAARCDMGSCFEAKRLTRDLASIVADTTEDPAAFYHSLGLETEEVSENKKREAEARCGYPGQPCGKVKRDAMPEPEADVRCGYPGQPCNKAKREADPEADARCGYPGQPCSKLKRAAEAVAEAIAEAEPSARCGYPGQPCSKAKRDAFALAHAADLVLGNL
ncbi:hypothetical protein BDZ45DRAFT_681774 [Acephala macrosclerotiorum]|nr:hypothetical protein BDZ45DRAFT_681774 [Acephala macrosclerotiorum]